MEVIQYVARGLQRLGTCLVMMLLAACGSSSSEEETQCPQLVVALTAGLGCLGTVTVTSPPPPANPPPVSPPPPPAPGSNIVRMAFHSEYEPNDTPDNANPVGFRTATADEHIGIEIAGAVSQGIDQADFFIFTPPRRGPFLVYLCADTCADSLRSDEVYLMVYDQSQTTIASTPVGGVETQRLAVELEAGLAYYVEVNGYNSGETAEDYKLVIID